MHSRQMFGLAIRSSCKINVKSSVFAVVSLTTAQLVLSEKCAAQYEVSF